MKKKRSEKSEESDENGGPSTEECPKHKDAVDFDALLPYIGEFGLYQKVFYLLMCIPTMPAAFLAFNQVFLSAEPQHWCKVAAFEDFAQVSNLSLAHKLRLSIPRRDLGRGLENYVVYESCVQYDVNFTEVFVQNGYSWPERPDRSWNLTYCREGWQYDTSEYKNTLVTEVRMYLGSRVL
jgi:hypothetical protein